MNTSKEIQKSDEQISFQEKAILRRIEPEDLLTMHDADENKMPALKKLLLKMYEFNRELESIGISLKNTGLRGGRQKGYTLTIPKYRNQCTFTLNLYSSWFDIKEGCALHAGFVFHLYINQEIHPEIGDWVRICIEHFDTKPFSWASERNYSGNRYLRSFYRGDIFFDGLDLGPEYRQGIITGEFTFKTEPFEKAISDACILLDHIIAHKSNVRLI